MSISMTDEFEQWCGALHELDQGRIIGRIKAFDRLRTAIFEPHGRMESASRHANQMYSISPQRGSNAFEVFCILGATDTYVIHGYDANVYFSPTTQLNAADDLVDQQGPFA
jgi:hypothetical protein